MIGFCDVKLLCVISPSLSEEILNSTVQIIPPLQEGKIPTHLCHLSTSEKPVRFAPRPKQTNTHLINHKEIYTGQRFQLTCRPLDFMTLQGYCKMS